MTKKETTSSEDFMTVIGILEQLKITYWIDGGWGIDLLVGKQTRIHRDIDVDFDAQYTEKLLAALKEYGYVVDTDWAPVRMELYSERLGYLDIHPFILHEDGSSKQANPEGGYFEFEADYFGCGIYEGKTIPCISAKGQRIFHTGYELREVDRQDLKIIEGLLKERALHRIDASAASHQVGGVEASGV